MPGEAFETTPGPSALRLNFSLADEAAAERGLAVLGSLLREDAARGAVEVLQEGREVAHIRRRDLDPAPADA